MTDITDRITAWEERQQARLARARDEIDRARQEQIAARVWADRCWDKVQRLDEYIERLQRLYEISNEDEIIRAKLVLAQNDARRAWAQAVRADFRVKRADIRLRRAILLRDEASYNLGLIKR